MVKENLTLPVSLDLGGTVVTTLDDYKTNVEHLLSSRYTYVVTEENQKDVEADCKELSTIYKTLSNTRKSALANFKKMDKEMIAVENLVEAKRKELKGELDVFAQRLLDEKYAQLETYYEANDLSEIVPLETLLKDFKWQNKGNTVAKCIEYIDFKADTVKTNLSAFKMYNLDDVEKQMLRNYYLDCLDVSTAMSMLKKYQEETARAKAQAEAVRKAKEEAEAKKKEEANTVNKELETVVPLEDEILPSNVNSNETKVNTGEHENIAYVFRIVANREFWDKMNDFIAVNKPVDIQVLKKEVMK